MIKLFKPPVFTTTPATPYISFLEGPRCSRRKYICAFFASMLPWLLLIFHLASANSTEHPEGPAGSALVLLYREIDAILLAIVAAGVMAVICFFLTMGRLRDINASPALVGLLFVPVVGVILILVLLVIPSSNGRNKYVADSEIDSSTTGLEIESKQHSSGVPSDKHPLPDRNEDTGLRKLRNWAAHRTIQSDLNSIEEARDNQLSLKQLLREKELVRVVKSKVEGARSKIVVAGFDRTHSKYFLSVSKIGTPVEQFKREYFINLETLSSSLLLQTGLQMEHLIERNA